MLVDIEINGMSVTNASVEESTRCGSGSNYIVKLITFNIVRQ